MFNFMKFAATSFICVFYFGCASYSVKKTSAPPIGGFFGDVKADQQKSNETDLNNDLLKRRIALRDEARKSNETKNYEEQAIKQATLQQEKILAEKIKRRFIPTNENLKMTKGESFKGKSNDHGTPLKGVMSYPNGVKIRGYTVTYNFKSGEPETFSIQDRVTSKNGDRLYLYKPEKTPNDLPTKVTYHWQGFYSLMGTIESQKLLQEQFREDSNIQVDFEKGSEFILAKQNDSDARDWKNLEKFHSGKLITKIFFAGEVASNNSIKNGIFAYIDGSILYGDFELIKYHQGAEKFRGLKHKGEKVWGQMDLKEAVYIGEIKNNRPNGYGVLLGSGAPPVEGLFESGELTWDESLTNVFMGITKKKRAFYLAGFQAGKTFEQIKSQEHEKEQEKAQQAKVQAIKNTDRREKLAKRTEALEQLLRADPELNSRFYKAAEKIQFYEVFKKSLKEKLRKSDCTYSKKTRNATREARRGPRESEACVKAKETLRSRGRRDREDLGDSFDASHKSLHNGLKANENLKELGFNELFNLLENKASRVNTSQVIRDYPYLDMDLDEIREDDEQDIARDRRRKERRKKEEEYYESKRQKQALQDDSFMARSLREIAKGAPTAPAIKIPKSNSNPYYEAGVKRSQAYENKKHSAIPVPHKRNVPTSKITKGSGATGNTKNQAVASAPTLKWKTPVATPKKQGQLVDPIDNSKPAAPGKTTEPKFPPPAKVTQVQPPYVQKSVEVVGVTPMAYQVDTAIDLAQLKVLNHRSTAYRSTACGSLNKSTVSWSAPICMKAKGSKTQFFCKQNATISCWSDFCNKVTDLCADGSEKTRKRTHVEINNPKGFEIISAPSLTILK